MAGKSPKLGSKLSNGQHHHHQNGNGASSSSSVELQNLLEEETSLHEPQLQQQQSRKERSRLLSPIAVLFYLALWTLLMFTDSSPPPPPPIQYALMLDAGSSGSRIHIYKFKSYDDASGQLLVSPDLVDETFIPIKPGLSHFKDDPVAAAESLDQLLDKAVEQVPKELHAITPMALKATAGLRLIGEAKSNAILAQVRKHLSEKYPFPIADIKAPGVDGVSLMDGIDEGVYAWITVNYLSSRLGQSTKVPTIAIMDLGGGSTQIVFEPNQTPISPPLPSDPKYKYDLDFNRIQYSLYQQSYLNYGLNEARRRIKQAAVVKSPSDPGIDSTLACLPKDVTLQVKVPVPSPHDDVASGHVETSLKGSGLGFDACRQFIKSHLLDKKAACDVSPCSFDGVFQPKLDGPAFSTGEIYIFSYFYDRTEPFKLGSDISLLDIRNLANRICKASDLKELTDLLESKMGVDMAHPDIKDEKEHLCMDLSYIYELLSTGYDLPDNRQFKVMKKVKGFETGWCLGASIQMLDALASRGGI